MKKTPEEKERDEVLKRMLSTPPNHKKSEQEKPVNGKVVKPPKTS